jgi:hypothetical protein
MAPPSQRYSPYQGLIPYTEQDSNFFFGREKETRLVIANLFASPLTLLYGPSGVGKSSVLRAGAASELARRDQLDVVVKSDWKNNPLTDLKSVLGEQAGLGKNFDTRLALAGFLQELVRRNNRRLMIILDQFEEYFFYHPLEDEFAVQFSRAVMQSGLPVSFLISIREDSLAKLDRFEGRIPILFDNYLRLEHLDASAARSAIEKPIEKYNEIYRDGNPPILIEPELREEILRQLETGHVSLNRTGRGKAEQDARAARIETPYLQLVLTHIWDHERHARSRVLRLATLHNLGGAEKIVRTHLDSVMNRLSSDHQLLASRIFQYLVTPSGTKIALTASDLASFVDSPTQVVTSLLERLSEPDVRLLRTIESDEQLDVSYEIFHDVLASPILDWRERWIGRYKLRQRGTMLVVAVILAVATAISALCMLTSSVSSQQTNTVLGTLICLAPLLALGLVIGFFAGINWSRVK